MSELSQFPSSGPVCPECGAQLARSKGPARRTLMATTSGYDEDDVYHRHDPNQNVATYECENGHTVRRTSQPACPADGCDFGGESEIEVVEE